MPSGCHIGYRFSGKHDAVSAEKYGHGKLQQLRKALFGVKGHLHSRLLGQRAEQPGYRHVHGGKPLADDIGQTLVFVVFRVESEALDDGLTQRGFGSQPGRRV